MMRLLNAAGGGGGTNTTLTNSRMVSSLIFGNGVLGRHDDDDVSVSFG